MSYWNNERVELLRKLWADGLSASQIAAELGGITRNGVIGKVHRLKLSGRAKPSTVARIRKPRTTNTYVVPKKHQKYSEVVAVDETGQALLRIPGSAAGNKFGKPTFLTATERAKRGALDDQDFAAFRCSERREGPSMEDIRWMERHLYAPLLEPSVQ